MACAHPLQPYLALGSALLMWLIAFAVTSQFAEKRKFTEMLQQPRSDPSRPHLSRNYSFGVLQLTWLLGQKNNHVAEEFQSRVAGEPLPEKLREEGKNTLTLFHQQHAPGEKSS